MKISGLRSVCRKKKYNYIKSAPEVTAENILNRNFKAKHSCEKWLSDVPEFKYGDGKKEYLSAILNLEDRSIVSYVICTFEMYDYIGIPVTSIYYSYINKAPIFRLAP